MLYTIYCTIQHLEEAPAAARRLVHPCEQGHLAVPIYIYIIIIYIYIYYDVYMMST